MVPLQAIQTDPLMAQDFVRRTTDLGPAESQPTAIVLGGTVNAIKIIHI